MLKTGNAIQLNNLTELDLAVAKGALAKPRAWNALLDVLRERGLRPEQGYVDHLREKGIDIENRRGSGASSNLI